MDAGCTVFVSWVRWPHDVSQEHVLVLRRCTRDAGLRVKLSAPLSHVVQQRHIYGKERPRTVHGGVQGGHAIFLKDTDLPAPAAKDSEVVWGSSRSPAPLLPHRRALHPLPISELFSLWPQDVSVGAY